MLGLNGVTQAAASISGSDDPAIAASNGSAQFTGFAKVTSLNLQYASFGDWIIYPCADLGDSCAPAYVVMVAGAIPGGSLTSAMPTAGSATYGGLATGIVEQSNDAARFKGNVGLTADFTSGTIDGQIASILAFDTETDTQLGTINDIGLTATISGARYSGTAKAIGRAGTAFDIAGASGQVTGGFYGPSAIETAGVFYLDGGTNNTHLTGAFGAKAGTQLITQFREIAAISAVPGGLTATLNTDLSGAKGTITSTDNSTPSGFSATTAFITSTNPTKFVVAVGGGNNNPTPETITARAVTERPLQILPAGTDTAVTASGGGYFTDFAEAAGLAYTSFGTWTLAPCSNSASCAPAYVGTFGGSQSEAYQTTVLPSTGTATYTGGATGFVAQGGEAARFYGTSTLTANFASGAVTGGVSSITAYDIGSDAALGAVNNIGITATIAGTGFAGVTTTTGPAGNAFDTTGATGTVNGAFYGPNAQEVAGVFNLQGGANGTTLLGSFGAKQ